jgi:hypothetical protein
MVRYHHGQGTLPREQLWQEGLLVGRLVRHDHDGHARCPRHGAQERLQGIEAAGGGADAYREKRGPLAMRRRSQRRLLGEFCGRTREEGPSCRRQRQSGRRRGGRWPRAAHPLGFRAALSRWHAGFQNWVRPSWDAHPSRSRRDTRARFAPADSGSRKRLRRITEETRFAEVPVASRRPAGDRRGSWVCQRMLHVRCQPLLHRRCSR